MATFIFLNNTESLYGRQPSCLNWITILPLVCGILNVPYYGDSDSGQLLQPFSHVSAQVNWHGTSMFSPLVIRIFFGQVECVEWLSYWTCCIFWPGTPLGVAPCPQTYVGLLIRLNVRAGIIGPWQVESITTTAVISWLVLRALFLQASVSGCWALSEFLKKKKNRLIYRLHISACHLSLIREGLGLFPYRFTRWNNTGVLQILGGVGDNEQMTLIIHTHTYQLESHAHLMQIWCILVIRCIWSVRMLELYEMHSYNNMANV